MTRPLQLPAVSAVTGVSHRQAVLRDIVEGDVLDIVAVDDNPYDADAVEVRRPNGEIAGFIPAALAPRLRAGGAGPWIGVVEAVLRNTTWGLRIKVAVPGTVPSDGDTDEVPLGEYTGDDDYIGDAEFSDTAAVEAGPVEEKNPTVKAASGRVLGELVRIEGSTVVVRASSGSETRYPAGVVTIGVAA